MKTAILKLFVEVHKGFRAIPKISVHTAQCTHYRTSEGRSCYIEKVMMYDKTGRLRQNGGSLIVGTKEESEKTGSI